MQRVNPGYVDVCTSTGFPGAAKQLSALDMPPSMPFFIADIVLRYAPMSVHMPADNGLVISIRQTKIAEYGIIEPSSKRGQNFWTCSEGHVRNPHGDWIELFMWYVRIEPRVRPQSGYRKIESRRSCLQRCEIIYANAQVLLLIVFDGVVRILSRQACHQ